MELNGRRAEFWRRLQGTTSRQQLWSYSNFTIPPQQWRERHWTTKMAEEEI
jgi:hypothetical protein